MSDILYYERVIERIGEHVTMSDVTVATPAQIDLERLNHANGNCQHTIVEDTAGWPYDFRCCVICGRGLGTV